MIRVWPWPLAPAVHSTRKRRSESRGLDSWFAGGSFSVAATGPAGHAVASAAVSGSATVTISDRHELIGIPPVLWPAGGPGRPDGTRGRRDPHTRRLRRSALLGSSRDR